jgi:hypothetical protein
MRRWWKSKTRKHYLDPAGFIRLWKAHNRLACHFASCYPDDVVVLPIEQIIGQDQKVLNYLNQRFDIALRYNPIGSIYDPESFHHQPAPVVLDHLFALFGCQQVEDYLLAQKPPLDKA